MRLSLFNNHGFKIKAKKTNLLIVDQPKIIEKASADIIVVISSSLLKQPKLVQKKERPFLITAPGEYEVAGISFFNQKEFLLIDVDGIRLGLLKQLENDLTAAQLEEIDGVDILLIGFNQKKEALTKVIKRIAQIQPRILVLKENKVVREFLKELRQEETEQVVKLAVVKSDLPEEMKIIVLKNKDGNH